MNIRENVALRNYSTLRVGGPARFFIVVESISKLREAIHFAEKKSLPFFVLGGGTNTYFSDTGFSGVVIQLKNRGVKLSERSRGVVRVEVAAGENWDDFVQGMVDQKLYGLENLSFIPGLVGASPIQNIGAYGKEVKDLIAFVEVFDTRDGSLQVFSNAYCDFSYRNSFFKSREGKNFIITSVTFELLKNAALDITYKDLQNYFYTKNTIPTIPKEVREAVIRIRKKKLPDPKQVGTLGSFFKNPIVTESVYDPLKKIYPEMPAYELSSGRKIPAAWLIDKVCGLKGYHEGPLGTHETQPLAIVSDGGASAQEVRNFARMIKEKVKERTGIELTEEVNFVT